MPSCHSSPSLIITILIPSSSSLPVFESWISFPECQKLFGVFKLLWRKSVQQVDEMKMRPDRADTTCSCCWSALAFLFFPLLVSWFGIVLPNSDTASPGQFWCYRTLRTLERLWDFSFFQFPHLELGITIPTSSRLWWKFFKVHDYET